MEGVELFNFYSSLWALCTHFFEEFLCQFYNLIGWRFVILHITLGSIGLVSTQCKRELCLFSFWLLNEGNLFLPLYFWFTINIIFFCF